MTREDALRTKTQVTEDGRCLTVDEIAPDHLDTRITDRNYRRDELPFGRLQKRNMEAYPNARRKMRMPKIQRSLSPASVMDERHLRSYLLRKAEEQQEIIDEAAVFSKRYDTAVDELEEIKELLSVGLPSAPETVIDYLSEGEP